MRKYLFVGIILSLFVFSGEVKAEFGGDGAFGAVSDALKNIQTDVTLSNDLTLSGSETGIYGGSDGELRLMDSVKITGDLTVEGAATIQSDLTLDGAASDLYVDGKVLATADNSGVLTLGGTGGANNENITLDFETAGNIVTLSSGTGVVNTETSIAHTYLDDTVLGFGETFANPDAKMIWETEGNDNLQIGTDVNAATSSGYISIMEEPDLGNANRSPSGTSANPVLRVYSSDATVAADYGEQYHDQTDYNIATGAGAVKWTIAEGTGSLKMATYQDADWDDLETISLPDGAIGHGTLQAGTDGTMEGGIFSFYDDAPVVLAVSANVQTTDADNKLVIFTDSGVTKVKNQLGNNQVLTMTIWYYIP